MSFINLGDEYEKVEEARPVPEGLYDVKILDVKPDSDETTGALKGLRIQIEPEVDAESLGYEPANIMHYMSIPNDVLDTEADEKKGKKPGDTGKFKRLMVKRFVTAFGIQVVDGQLDPSDFHGAQARLQVKHDSYEGNVTAKIQLPPLDN